MNIQYYGKEYEVPDTVQLIATNANGRVWGYRVLEMGASGEVWIAPISLDVLLIDDCNKKAAEDWKHSLRFVMWDMPDHNIYGRIRSPGRQLKRGKHTYRPTEIEGERHVFKFVSPLTVKIRLIGNEFLVSCRELDIHWRGGKTVETALAKFVFGVEGAYEEYVKGRPMENRTYLEYKLQTLFGRYVDNVQEKEK